MEKEAFEYKRLLQLKKMSLEELNSYYRMLRGYEFSIDKPLESSELKKRIHALTMLILKIDKLLTGRKVEIFDDKRTGTLSKGKVYASSHVGRYDIESAMEAINEQTYFVMGDPGETYRNFEGFFLENIHGRICVDTGYQVFDLIMRQKNGYQISEEEKSIIEEYKNDRRICEAICTKRIEKKDNILIYPEGAWNITDRLMQPLFNGAARIAINGNGVLVPIGIIRENKRYIVNIGNYFNVEGAQDSDVKDVTRELKELIYSLKGEIVFADENQIHKRSEFKSPEENIQANIDDIMSETTNGYTIDVIKKSRFYDPDAPENVFNQTLRKKL